MFRIIKNVLQKIFGNIEVNSEICSGVQRCSEMFMKKFGDYKLCLES